MTTELADNVRKYRRRAGMSQEELAHAAGVSPGTVRKAEQGGTLRMETLHTLARALRVTTAALMASDAPEPVGRTEEPNRVNLIQLRAALTPAVGLVDQDAEAVGEEPNLRTFRRTLQDARVLYFSDSYKSVAAQLPGLLRDAAQAVAYYDSGDEHRQALLARAEALRLAGTYLTQVRQYDIAYAAVRGAIMDARQAGDMLAAGSGVGCMCWLLVRQGRLDEAEQVAARSMDAVEPKITGAEPDHYAVWGGLAMEAAAAAARNNRPDEAKAYRQAARVAATAVGTAHRNVSRHWSVFGPVTVAVKALEDSLVIGDARAVVRKAGEQEELSPKAWKRLGRPSTNDGNRFTLDVARAHTRTGDLSAAMDELTRAREAAPQWLRHQNGAAETMQEILGKRKRTLTTEMREMADYLGVVGLLPRSVSVRTQIGVSTISDPGRGCPVSQPRSEADRMRRRGLYDATSGGGSPRLLPWTNPEGKPCYPSVDGQGYFSTLAHSIETVQISMGQELLEYARDATAPGAKALSATELPLAGPPVGRSPGGRTQGQRAVLVLDHRAPVTAMCLSRPRGNALAGVRADR
ncbi:helix-turn-helix domain-containing protein [Streptomyces sp. NPDC055036]